MRLPPCRPLLLLLLLAGSLNATTAPSAAAPEFLAPDAVDFHAILQPPPAEDSLAAAGELEVLRQLEAHRTPAQVAFAKEIEAHTIFTFGRPVLGPEFDSAAHFPRTAAVMKQAYYEARPVILAAKQAWSRRRPYVVDPTLQPCVAHPPNDSYPSGHVIESAVWSVLMSHLLPEHAAAFERRVHDTMWGRQLGGVHFASDTVAGKALGEALGRAMLKSPKLLQALEEVRAELAALHLKKAA